MTIGLLALMATFATTIRATEIRAGEIFIARHKALDAMESIYTARKQPSKKPFAAINNLANGGIFLEAEPSHCSAPDPMAIVGTADDVPCTAPGHRHRLPGRSGVPGAARPRRILGTPMTSPTA